MAVELATAYFTFLPSMAGTAAAAAPGLRALEGQAAVSGARSGALMGGALAGGIGKFIPVIGGALAGIGIADFFTNAVDAASDLNESANAVKVSFGDAAAEVDKLGQTAAHRLGLSNNDFNALAVRFSSFARTIAGDGGNVAATLDELTTRGADFASVYNIEAADALALFQSGLAGESEPLRRYGVDISAATVANTAYRLGIAATGVELTEQQKVQARYQAILEQTAAVEGDRANTADQLANQQRENAAVMADALARIGTALLPAATAFAQFIGSPENTARLEHMVDLLIKSEPVIESIADALIVIADVKFSELDTLLAFFDAVGDGNVSLKEAENIFLRMPGYLQGWTNTVSSIWATTSNAVIDAENVVLGGVAAISNAIRGLLGIRGTIQIKIPHVAAPHFSLTKGKNISTHQAGGGRTTGAGWSWVGEQGPELAYMPVGARVVPNDQSMAAMAGGLDPQAMRLLRDMVSRTVELNVDGQTVARGSVAGNARLSALGAS